jgi:Methyltransferase domain
MTDWAAWHDRYDDPTSTQARRLVVVRRRVRGCLDALGGDDLRVLSLCAGDGRDLIPELGRGPDRNVAATLIEWNAALADRARAAARAAGLDRVEVRTGDAGLASAFADVVPVDLLLLCGIFGNVPERDIRQTVAAVPAMLRPAGLVIWTRGLLDGADLRPSVRRWVGEVGLREVAYDGEPEPFGVGVACRSTTDHTGGAVPDRLFTFEG